MSRTPAALALAVLSIGSRSIGAEPCPPRAELAGDPAAVARVRGELDKLGVSIGSPGPGCRAIHAEVELDERGGIAVAVGDGTRRSEGRVVSDAAVAAAWIDSWLRDDDLGGQTTAIVAARTAPPAETPPVPPPARSIFDRGGLGVAYEAVLTGDDASWSGGSAAACANLGPVCVGLRVRYAHASTTPPNSYPEDRSELAALATASTSLAVGRMALVPELALGVGQFSAARHGLCKLKDPMSCDPTTDPNCTQACDASGNGTTGETVTRSVDSFEPRCAAALRIAIPLFDHVWLDALASVTYIPFAHELPFKPDPNSLPANTDLNAYTLPGEPTSSIQLGIGLRVGVP